MSEPEMRAPAMRRRDARLIFGKKDLGAVRQDQDLFFSADYMEPAVFIPSAQVAGIEHAVLEHCCCVVGLFIVALHHAAFGRDEDLAVGSQRDCVFGTDLQCIGVKRGTARNADRDPGAGLRQTIAEADRDALLRDRVNELRRAVARADQDQAKLRIHKLVLHQET